MSKKKTFAVLLSIVVLIIGIVFIFKGFLMLGSSVVEEFSYDGEYRRWFGKKFLSLGLLVSAFEILFLWFISKDKIIVWTILFSLFFCFCFIIAQWLFFSLQPVSV
jgi:hypothetical protein